MLVSLISKLHHRLSTSARVAWLVIFLAACQSTGPAPDATTTPARQPSTSTPTRRAITQPARTPTVVSTPSSTLGVDPQDLDGVTVAFWHVWNELPGSALEALVNEFNSQNEWGVRVNSRFIGTFDDLFTSVSSALGTPDQPDIVVGFNYQAANWDTKDQIVDLNPYTNDPIWGLGQAGEDFYPPFWNSDVLNGKRLGIPAVRTGQYLFYNQTWAAELGFESAPSTTTQFRQQACAAAEANRDDSNSENDGTGGYILTTDYSAVLAWIAGFGGDILAPQADGYQFDTPAVQNTFRYLRDLYDRGCAWLSEDQLPDTDFADRRGLFASGSLLDVPEQFFTFSQTSDQDRWTLIPYPSARGEPVIDVYGPSFEILQSTPERELAAWLFIRWLSEPEHQIRLTAATSSLPLRHDAQKIMSANPLSPQWQAAVEAIQYSQTEPPLSSWRNVRWAVSDAATQLFRYYFTIDQVPTLVKLLDSTAQELLDR